MSRREATYGWRALLGALLILILLLPVACDGDGPTEPSSTRIVVVGIARNDISPANQLEGLVAFFFDLDREEFLHANASVNGIALSDSLLPGTVPGPIYGRSPSIHGGTAYSLTATVFAPEGSVEVSSEAVTAPLEFVPTIPDVHPLGEPLTVEWPDLPDAETVNVAVPASGFEADVAAAARSFTIPAAVFEGLEGGARIEVELTAYNVFYVSIATAISDIQDAEAFARRFADIDNIDGAVGAFGAAVSTGKMITLQ